MIWVWVVILVVIIGAIAVVAAGRGDAMVEAYDDRPDTTLPTGRPLTAEDLEAVRLSTAVRGYRMDEVDALLARIRADLRARESSDPPTGLPAGAVDHNQSPLDRSRGFGSTSSSTDGSATASSAPDGSVTASSAPDGSVTASSAPDGSASAPSSGASAATPPPA